MRTFDYRRVPAELHSREISDCVVLLHEDKGRLSVFRDFYPQTFETLAQQAYMDNVEASARIEGIYPTRKRVEEVVSGDTCGEDAQQLCANEDELRIVGYSRALRMLDAEIDELDVSTSTILSLYETLFFDRDLGSKSRYRRKDYIYANLDGRMQAVPVSPIPAFETPLVLGGAVDSLNEAFGDGDRLPIMLIGQFAVDFLCIRPFDEGNGRIVRLFTDLLLRKCGFDINKYMSIDKIIESHASEYYQVLNECAVNWNVRSNTYLPFVKFWFAVLHLAYERLFCSLNASAESKSSKRDRVRSYFVAHPTEVTKRQILSDCPDISEATVESALTSLVKEGFIEKVGAGRATSYRRKS